ncbi:DUF2510 domain-containing protein [Rhodococcus erythropolis]|uniref:DUF2510 domain-containing protein n=1 Tax=Rhodococcus erythropolis TaxID=1833 RepID=UPI001BEA23C7|nr:DUF2510 domain-containing protein [Rhodococcus erythropolis]MBT2266975.1 DUF2510 domain-containing protein [Rhodococcus erythropolis]
MDDKRVRGVLYLLGVVAFAIIVSSDSAFNTSPVATLLALVIVGIPIAIVVLVIRALIRVGDKPQPVQFVAPTFGLSADWYPDQQNPAWIRWYDGTQWTHHVQPATTPPPPPNY